MLAKEGEAGRLGLGAVGGLASSQQAHMWRGSSVMGHTAKGHRAQGGPELGEGSVARGG